jgi:aquaporin related protein
MYAHYYFYIFVVDTKFELNVNEEKVERQQGQYLTLYATNGKTKAGFAPIAIGLTLGSLCLLGGSVSGVFNPARALGPAFVTNQWRNHELYWIANLFGSGLAAVAQRLLSHDPLQS